MSTFLWQWSSQSAKLHMLNPAFWHHIIKLQKYGFCQKYLPTNMDPQNDQSHIKKLSRLYLLSCSEIASWLRNLVTSLRNVWMCVLILVAVSPLLISRGEAGSDTGWSSLICSILQILNKWNAQLPPRWLLWMTPCLPLQLCLNSSKASPFPWYINFELWRTSTNKMHSLVKEVPQNKTRIRSASVMKRKNASMRDE